MCVADSQSEPGGGAVAELLAHVRTRAGIAAHFELNGDRPKLGRLSEYGGYRARFPHTAGDRIEAVVVNTGGGLVGGDRVAFDWRVGPGANVTIMTVAAERVYRSLAPASEVDVAMTIGAGARTYWLPQETILFSGARLRRRFEVDLDGSARVLLAEAIVFGRAASGERMGVGLLHDVWRVRRDGRLVFAEGARLDGDIGALLARPAVAAGARAMALLLYVAPDAEARVAEARDALRHARSLAGASAWNGLLAVRFLAYAAEGLRADLINVVERLTGGAMPRIWTS